MTRHAATARFECANETNTTHTIAFPPDCNPKSRHFVFFRSEQSEEEVSDAARNRLAVNKASPSTRSPSIFTSRLLSLPPELLLVIVPMLPYPDALALKHTHPMFYNTIDTSVRLKVAWLLDRKVRGLPTPEKNCCLKSDSEFCQGGLVGGWEKGKRRGKAEDSRDQVSRIMARRRRHGECNDGRCEVLVGWSCRGRKEIDHLKLELFGLRRWGTSGFGRERWWAMWLYSVIIGYGFLLLVGFTGGLFGYALKSFWLQ